MVKSYNILRKKSIVWLLGGLFLFFSVPCFAALPSDPDFHYQSAMWRQIGADKAWNYATGSPEVIVAVLDTGIDINNPDLSPNIWLNAYEIPDNGVDDDFNGYIDDIHGWNFVGNNNDVLPSDDPNFFDKEAESHGTIISGLIGAAANNGYFGAGLNWKVKIMPLRTIDQYGSGSYSDIAKAVDYAAGNGAHIISTSFVGDVLDDAFFWSLRRAYGKGLLVLGAAGNYGTVAAGNLDQSPLYPICFNSPEKDNWLLGVTAVDDSDRLSAFSNHGSCVDLSAPGENIFSTQKYTQGKNVAGFGGPWLGTSFAVPLVAGSAALLKSIRPDWTADDLISALLSSADDIDGLNKKYAGQIGYGRLNIGKAIEKAYADKRNSSLFSPICYPVKNRIYCKNFVNDKTTFVTAVKNPIISLDWNGEETIVALSAESGRYRIDRIGKNGLVNSTWLLEKDVLFDQVKLAVVNNESRIFVSGFQTKKNRTRIVSFGLTGSEISSWWAQGPVDSFAVDKKGVMALAGLKSGVLVVEFYDHSGKFSSKITLGKAKKAEAAIAGKMLSGIGASLSLVVRRDGGAYRYIVYPDSSSYLSERLADTVDKWRLMSADSNFDGLAEFLAYHAGGGKFDIVTDKGKTLDIVDLPKLK